MEEYVKNQIKETLIECINDSLDLILDSSKKKIKISDKNQIKGDNPVTEIDINSQKLIVSKIKKRFPDHEILGEEGKEDKIVKSDYLWIIDPIDGTKNFINQIPFFCVAIAIMYKGEIIGGGVGLPWKEKSIIYAIKDEGITSNFLQENFQELKNVPIPGILSFAPTYFNLSYIIKKEFYKNSGELRNLGSAAAEISLVANGNAQLALSGFAFCWDFAAAWIIIKESNKSIYHGNMEKNIWEDKNPWQKYFENGTYNLGKMKNWRGKFFASNKEIEKFILKNVRPNGRSKTDFYRRLKKFLFLR